MEVLAYDLVFDIYTLVLIIMIIWNYWVYVSNKRLNQHISRINQKIVKLKTDFDNTHLLTSKIVDEKMSPIEQSLSDVRNFTQMIDLNIRLLIDKIDSTVKHSEQ